MPFLNKAFYVVDLRTGSEYIGWVGAVLTVLSSLASVYDLTIPHSVHSHIMFDIIIAMAQFLISVCLIRAAKDNNRKLLVPWLVGTIITVVLRNLFVLVLATNNQHHVPFLLLGLLIMDAIIAYLWACVYSFYQLLDEAPIAEPETIIIEDDGTSKV